MTLFTKRQQPGDPVERTPAEIFEAIDAQRDALRDRLEVARTRREDLAATATKERAAYLSGLAQAEIHGTPAEGRAALAHAENDLADTSDRVAGLELAVAEFEPDWRRAKAAMLLDDARAIRAETAEHQACINERTAEIKRLEREIGDYSSKITHRGPVQAVQRENEAQQLLR